MRFFTTTILSLTLLASISTSANAAENDKLCDLYSKVGGTVVGFMLPLTLQDFVNMQTGKDPRLLQELSTAMVSDMDGKDMATMIGLGGADGEVLGTAAGQVAIELLMGGQATSKEEVVSQMKSHCDKIGGRTIIDNQKKAIAATNANLGK